MRYTGDFSREEDRHLPAAEIPPLRLNVVICESTYGRISHESRREREDRLTSDHDGDGNDVQRKWWTRCESAERS